LTGVWFMDLRVHCSPNPLSVNSTQAHVGGNGLREIKSFVFDLQCGQTAFTPAREALI